LGLKAESNPGGGIGGPKRVPKKNKTIGEPVGGTKGYKGDLGRLSRLQDPAKKEEKKRLKAPARCAERDPQKKKQKRKKPIPNHPCASYDRSGITSYKKTCWPTR